MDKTRRDEVRELMVRWILAARWEYLAAGANPLRHWDQIQDRIRAAARMSCDVPTWSTAVARGLHIGAASHERAAATVDLAALVAGSEMDWLDLVEAEHGYLMALARLRAEERSAWKRSATTGSTPPTREKKAKPVTAELALFEQEGS
jgi:hypothetical protein